MMQLRPYQKQAVKECWEALKKDDKPVLLMASVGAGKSLILADILLTLQKNNKHALCLVNNSELVRSNQQTFVDYGGKASIYCASLDSKDTSETVIFGSPQTVLNGINKNEQIADIKFNIILVDEAHTINFINQRSSFMRILNHYKLNYSGMRVLGATGTNFRFKGSAIVGDDCLFKSQIGLNYKNLANQGVNISMEFLIGNNYLVKPIFKIDPELVLDFSKVKVKSNGQFDSKQLSEVVEKSTRLTELICKQIIHIMETQKRFGVIIFASTKKHALEIMSHLPAEKSALILGDTPQDERTDYFNKARSGSIQYLVNISIVSTGVDIPAFDTAAYLRATESLVLLIQTLGRVLRLSPNTGKSSALVLDFAGNIERHKDWDSPVLLDAVRQTIDQDKPKIIKCPTCMELNTEHARRCVGWFHEKRCDYYFEFKDCPNESCKTKNDISCRHCRLCATEIIDPNARLSLQSWNENSREYEVIDSKYVISDSQTGFRINCWYKCQGQGKIETFYEGFTPNSEKAKHVFYGQFIKKHCKKPSDWYKHITDRGKMVEMLADANKPNKLVIIHEKDRYKIKKKEFI